MKLALGKEEAFCLPVEPEKRHQPVSCIDTFCLKKLGAISN